MGKFRKRHRNSFFPRASERRVLLLVGVCKSPSHLHIYTYHLLIFRPSHLHISHIIFSPLHLLINTSSSHLHMSPSHLHIFSSTHLLIFTSAHVIFSSSHLLIFTSAHLHICTRLLCFLFPRLLFIFLSRL